jgi:beta-glucosidase
VKAAIAIFLMSIFLASVRSDAGPSYKDPTKSIDARVEDLLARMTLQEKAGQMTMSVLLDSNANNVQHAGVPRVEATYGSYIYSPDVKDRNAAQKLAMEKSRLGIPAAFGSDVIHGCFLTLPIPVAQACSWNPELVRRGYSYAASEARRQGTDWVFAPMIDVTVDPRWGRISEGFGESPYAASVFAVAAVNGYQGKTLDSPDTVACTLKHYAAYGASEGGRDYSYTDVSPVRLWQMYLPPYEAGVKAGASSVMSSFNDLNGVPVTANHYMLTEVLRDRWGFKGVVVTDWNAVAQLMDQGYAASGRDALKFAVNAGIDIDMVSYLATKSLPELVQSGEVTQQRVDDSVRRILRMKFALGIFEHPYTTPGDGVTPERRKEGEQIAEELAEQSQVLLKNEGGILPLSPRVTRIALIGPMAADKSEVLGAWAYAAQSDRTITIERGLREALPPDVTLQTERGCDIEDGKRDGFAAAIDLAKQSDLVILCLGERAIMTGENASRSSLKLPGAQEDLALAVAETGKPVVLLVSSGRPVELQRLEPKMQAILALWQPGTMTGSAVAKLLTGQANPSGRLSVTWPRSAGQIPIYHDMHPRARRESDMGNYKDAPTTPQWEFGHGLSYTSFSYSPIRLDKNTVTQDGELTAEVTVANTGKMDGSETVFWFIHRPVASITQPIKELKYFEKASIPAGGSRVFRFTIDPARDLAFRDSQGNPVLEPGGIDLMAGNQTASFQLEK